MNDLPTSAYGVMRLLPDTRTGVEIFSNQLINAVRNGEVNPIQVKALFKVMEQVAKKVDEGIKQNLLTEADRYSEKKFNAFGFEIEKAELGTSYDYSTSGDPVYSHHVRLMEEAAAKVKEREAFLKSLKEPMTIVDDESGEIATVRPPVKKSTTGLKFTLK